MTDQTEEEQLEQNTQKLLVRYYQTGWTDGCISGVFMTVAVLSSLYFLLF